MGRDKRNDTSMTEKTPTVPKMDSVDDMIKNNKVMIFSKSYCPHCRKAKDALAQCGIMYRKDLSVCVLEIDELRNCQEIQDHLKTISGIRGVPQVFIGGKFFADGS